MAIYGIGANYNNVDVSDQFINQNMAYIGWDITEAPALHEILRCLKVGDIVYIKSAPIGKGLRIKGVGIITNNTILQDPNLGTGVTVNWLWSGHENFGAVVDKYNVRNNSLYEEFNKGVQTFILGLIFQP